MAEFFVAYGRVCGPCGHAHKKLETAILCARRHRRAVRGLGGGCWSDRFPHQADCAEVINVGTRPCSCGLGNNSAEYY